MHFYNADCVPCHEVIMANGKSRPSRSSDAKKFNWVPSVSTVKEQGIPHGIVEWYLKLMLKETSENPFHPDEYTYESWCKERMSNFEQVRSVASRRGTVLHNKLEDYYKTGVICPVDEPFIIKAIELIDKEFSGVKWKSEIIFANYEFGFGGCVDMHSDELVLDFKTKSSSILTNSLQGAEERMQLAAYQIGLGLPKTTGRYNLFISANSETPGDCLLVEAKEFGKYWDMFCTLNRFWQIKNDYIPIGGI